MYSSITISNKIRYYASVWVTAFFHLSFSAYAQTNVFPTSGNVGIGTTNPGVLLDVRGSIYGQGTIDTFDGPLGGLTTNYAQLNPNYTPSLYLVRSEGVWSSTWWNLTMNADNSLSLGFSSVPQMTFYNGTASFNNYVGIGTLTPVGKFQVSNTTSGLPPMLYGNATLSQFPRVVQEISDTISANSNSVVIGLNLENASQISGSYSPFVTFSRKSDSGSYNPTYAYVVGLETGEGPDSNWASGALIFGTASSSAYGPLERMRIATNGNVGIGTVQPAYPLSVNGTIEAKEVIVQTGWSDYVFAQDYSLTPLQDLAKFIKLEHHLPGIPSAAQVTERGVNLGEMQSKLLAKVEELTLHIIEQEKQLRLQASRIEDLEVKQSYNEEGKR